MNAAIGTYSLAGAVLTAAAVVLAAIAAARFESAGMLRAAKAGMGLFAAMLTVASIVLLKAMVGGDFDLDYVVHYTERALPTGYKLAAFWAGQEGSLLLWAWLLGGMSLIAALLHRGQTMRSGATFVGTLAVVCGFFAALMLFAANPFRMAEMVAADGRGLNPMLQDPGMIAHPPLLFMGYAGFTIPFALMMGALASGCADNLWVTQIRRWTIVSWLFLTVGILLGAQWAYVELGWGGYWAWDPVENASLLPWLTATALLHSIMIQQHRGMLKVWNVSLIAATFILCIFGTYLTRSGVVESVHTFGQSWVGTFFLGFLLLSVLSSAVMIVWRLRILKSENSLEGMLGREGAFLITNVLLFGMMLATLVGTIFPLLSGMVMSKPMSVGQPFYNKMVIPLAVALMGLMAIGPMLRYSNDPASRLGRGLVVPGLLGVLVAAVFWFCGISDPWALVCGAIVTVAVVVQLTDLGRAAIERTRAFEENPLMAALRLIDGNHRRYGGQIVHVGMLMIMVGVTGSSLYSVKETVQLNRGQSAKVGRYTLTFNELSEVRESNYIAVEALVTLSDDRTTRTLRPQRRSYYKFPDQPNTDVALESTLREDLYVTLAGWEEGKGVALQAIINPLVTWMWVGGIVMSVGGLFCLLPRLIPHMQMQTVAAAPAKQKARHGRVRPTVVNAN